MRKLYFLILFTTYVSSSQVGIGTALPEGALDVTSTINGMLVPRVALTATNASAPVSNPQGTPLAVSTLVWNTATNGTFPNNVIPGFYYWDGSLWISVTGASSNSWTVTGNGGLNGGNTTTAGTNFLGTTDAQNIDFRTNNTFRGRFSSLGEFFVGTLNTSLPGDLMNGVGNATFPWALNGYTSYAAGGVYGLRQSGSTGTWGAVQGELDASLPATSRGVSGAGAVNSHYGVYGYKPAGGTGFGGLFLNDLGYSGGVYNLSDERLKKNIKPLFNGIDKIRELKFYSYNFKSDEYDVVGGDDLHYGVMADELQKALPSLVKSKIIDAGKTRATSEDKQIKSIPFEVKTVNYVELIPIAIQAIKEQQAIIDNQNQRIERLEKLVNTLRKN